MILIGSNEYSKLKEKLDKKELVNFLYNYLIDNKISFPKQDISLNDAITDFNKLKYIPYINVLKKGDFITRFDYNTKYFKLPFYFGINNIGNKSSNYFHFDNRMKCGYVKKNDLTPLDVWNNEKYLKQVCKAYVRFDYDSFNLKDLFVSIQMQFYIASQFKPLIAKSIYDLFNSKNVLDYSSGWGDRLSGFCASNKTSSYIGCDPNLNLHKGYNEQIKLFGKNKKITIFPIGAEFLNYSEYKFDTIFTSPPYFNCEKYSIDEGQSFNLYRTYFEWRDNFLFYILEKGWESLEDEGFLIINISDIDKNKKICNEMNDFISTFKNSNYIGCIGYQMSIRPNIGIDKKLIYCEPVWIWRKGNKHFDFKVVEKKIFF